MRKFLSFGVAVAFATLGLGASPASADVFVFADIFKDKDVFVVEDVLIEKDVTLDVTVSSEPEKAAQAEGLINQTNTDNDACENCAEKRDRIVDSANDNSGVITVNQAAGNMNNQGSALSVAVDIQTVEDGDGPDSSTTFAHAQAAVEQQNTDNFAESVNILFKTTLIDESVNANDGIVGVNQAVGNMNNQANDVALAVGLDDDGVAIAEADLGQFNQRNTVLESNEPPGTTGINKTARIRNSVNGNNGVIGVNQASGNMANQANVVSVAAAQAGNGS